MTIGDGEEWAAKTAKHDLLARRAMPIRSLAEEPPDPEVRTPTLQILEKVNADLASAGEESTQAESLPRFRRRRRLKTHASLGL
jgi:hypothetical protein